MEADQKEQKAEPRTLVIDLGKKKRKRVKKLRKGRGRLMDRINDFVSDMKESGELNANADTMVVVVRQKRRKGWRW